jgi:hypothetical protein
MSSNKYFYKGTQLTTIFSDVSATPSPAITPYFNSFPPIAAAPSQNSVGVLQDIYYSISGNPVTSIIPITASYQDFNAAGNITVPSWCNSIAATITSHIGNTGDSGDQGVPGVPGDGGDQGPKGNGLVPTIVGVGVNCVFGAPPSTQCNLQFANIQTGPGGPGAGGGPGGPGGPGAAGGPGGTGGPGITVNISKYTFGSNKSLSITTDPSSVSLLNNTSTLITCNYGGKGGKGGTGAQGGKGGKGGTGAQGGAGYIYFANPNNSYTCNLAGFNICTWNSSPDQWYNTRTPTEGAPGVNDSNNAQPGATGATGTNNANTGQPGATGAAANYNTNIAPNIGNVSNNSGNTTSSVRVYFFPN